LEKKMTSHAGLPGAVFMGAGTGLLLLFLLTLAIAGLILGGWIPVQTPSSVLSLTACLCAWVGGRVAVNRSRSGTLVAGALTGGMLCVFMAVVCMGMSDAVPVSGPWLTTLVLLLTGGCLAGLMGRRKAKKTRKE